MKKSEINKEVAAIRRLERQREKLATEVRMREKALVAACPWKASDEVAWDDERGRVMSISGGTVEADPKSGNNYVWAITVHRYKKGTKQFARGNFDRFTVREGTNRAAKLKLWKPDPKDPEPRRFKITRGDGADNLSAVEGLKQVNRGETIELVELKPGFRIIRERK